MFGEMILQLIGDRISERFSEKTSTFRLKVINRISNVRFNFATSGHA